MSIEVTLHPKMSDKRGLQALLVEFGFERCSHLWNWPEDSLHFRWFSDVEYQSYDGVQATIFAPIDALDEGSRPFAWALHTRTRASASPAEREQQNRIVRAARKRFGGAFHNDSAGKNRCTRIADDGRIGPSRGLYQAYASVREPISAVQYALPDPTPDLERFVGTDLEPLSEADPQRVLDNALVPFALAAVEHFLSRSFKILLEFDPKARERLQRQTRKVEMTEALSIAEGETSIEDVFVGWYSFQNLDGIQRAFSEWFGMDIRKILRRRKRIGRRIVALDAELQRMIDARHDVIHRLHIDRDLRKPDISELLDTGDGGVRRIRRPLGVPNVHAYQGSRIATAPDRSTRHRQTRDSRSSVLVRTMGDEAGCIRHQCDGITGPIGLVHVAQQRLVQFPPADRTNTIQLSNPATNH